MCKTLAQQLVRIKLYFLSFFSYRKSRSGCELSAPFDNGLRRSFSDFRRRRNPKGRHHKKSNRDLTYLTALAKLTVRGNFMLEIGTKYVIGVQTWTLNLSCYTTEI